MRTGGPTLARASLSAALDVDLDSKTDIQALDRTQPALPMLPGIPARAAHNYVRNGSIDLFAALDVGSGTVITHTDRRHRAIEFPRVPRPGRRPGR